MKPTQSNSTDHLWGIDLGGTKIECVVLQSAQLPNVIERRRVSTNRDEGYEQILNKITGLVQSISRSINAKANSLGIGTPGTLDPATGLLRGSNTEELLGKPVRQDLQRLLGIPIAIENDANCFTLAETRMGAVSRLNAEITSVFGIIMGTGVGGGLVINNQLIPGRNLIAGEWGHNHLDTSGGKCYCGKDGCVETVISGPALEGYFTQLTGESKKLEDIVHLAETGNHDAKQTIDRLIHYFGIAASSIINLLDPDVIVIGGGVGNINRLYTDGVEEIKTHAFSPTVNTRILKPELGDSAGVFGAAFLTT